MTRALVASLCIALAVMACGPARAGQAPGPKEAAAAGKEAEPRAAPPQQSAATSPAPAIPQPEVLLVLIRTTLVALNQAIYTGNFTVLRDLGSPAFQAANSAAQLGVIFADLRNRNIDLFPSVVVTPELSDAPKITQEQILRLVGYFPTNPLQIQFQMLFQPVNGQWRLFGMAVNTAVPPATTAQETPPAPKAPRAKPSSATKQAD